MSEREKLVKGAKAQGQAVLRLYSSSIMAISQRLHPAPLCCCIVTAHALFPQALSAPLQLLLDTGESSQVLHQC